MEIEFVLFNGKLTQTANLNVIEVMASYDSSDDCFYGFKQEVRGKINEEKKKVRVDTLCKLIEDEGENFEFIDYDPYRDKFIFFPCYSLTVEQADKLNLLLIELIDANQQSAEKYVRIVDEVARFSAPVDIPVDVAEKLEENIFVLDQDPRRAAQHLLNLLELSADQREVDFLGGDFMFKAIMSAITADDSVTQAPEGPRMR